jgi:hypothetical protein
MPAAEIERFARAICGDDKDPTLMGPAVVIAENEYVLRAIRAQKIAVIERLRESTAIAFSKGDNSFTVAKARYLEMWLLHRELTGLVPKLLAKYKDQLPSSTPGQTGPDWMDDEGSIVPFCLKALLEEPEWTIEDEETVLKLAETWVAQEERDEYEAIEEAMSDLVRLARYERRAWSQHKRAIREFMDHKSKAGSSHVTAALGSQATAPSPAC